VIECGAILPAAGGAAKAVSRQARVSPPVVADCATASATAGRWPDGNTMEFHFNNSETPNLLTCTRTVHGSGTKQF
jgi:hypothetical protein